jgi:hypothetical protein
MKAAINAKPHTNINGAPEVLLMKAAIYARCNREGEEERVQHQIDSCHLFASERGIEVVSIRKRKMPDLLKI